MTIIKAKHQFDSAVSRFNETTGRDVDKAVFALCVAEDGLNTAYAAKKRAASYAVARKLRHMDQVDRASKLWLGVVYGTLALAGLLAVIWAVLKGR